MPEALTHLDEHGRAHMVDVGDKPRTARSATAQAVVRMLPATAALLARGDAPKGNVVAVARIAAIQAAKRTDELIPLCHGMALSALDVQIAVDEAAGTVTLLCTARTEDRTGVEMEAMVACSVGALTVYDMVKGVERGVRVEAVQLLAKSGGRSGTWRRDADAGLAEPAS